MIPMGVLICVGSLLVGALPFGLIVGKINGIDVRDAGSGNIGATNVTRLLGRGWGLLVLLLDVSKGLFPTLIYRQVVLEGGASDAMGSDRLVWLWLGVGFAAVVGHNFSPFLRFKGGKGVATSLGVALGIYPDLTVSAGISVVVWLVGVRVFGMVAVGSMLAGLAFPVGYGLSALVLPGVVTLRMPFAIFTLLTALMILIRHRANLARIMSGTEPRSGP